MKLFHLIIHGISPIKIPSYLKFYEGTTNIHLDRLSLVSNITPSGQTNPDSNRGFANSYFYHTHLLWNRLPLSLREIIRPSEFRTKIIQYIWKELVTVDNSEDFSDDNINLD